MEELIIEYDLHKDHLVTFYRDLYLNQRTSAIARRENGVFAKTLGLLVLIFVSLLIIGNSHVAVLWVIGVLMIGWLVLGFTSGYRKLVWAWTRRSLDKVLFWEIENNGNQLDAIHYTVRFTDDQFTIIKTKSESVYQWETILQVFILEEITIIYMSEVNCLIIPNEVLNQHPEVSRLIEQESSIYDLTLIDERGNATENDKDLSGK